MPDILDAPDIFEDTCRGESGYNLARDDSILYLRILYPICLEVSPSNLAALAWMPPHCRSASEICSHSMVLTFPGNESSKGADTCSTAARSECRRRFMCFFNSEASILVSRVIMTPRSTQFSSSRTFPGHPYRTMASIASGKNSTHLPCSSLHRFRKCSMSNGISATRSRNDGR